MELQNKHLHLERLRSMLDTINHVLSTSKVASKISGAESDLNYISKVVDYLERSDTDFPRLLQVRFNTISAKYRIETNLKRTKSESKRASYQLDLETFNAILAHVNEEIEVEGHKLFEETTALLEQMYMSGKENVGIFVNAGWGDFPVEVTVVADGNGQEPLSIITLDTLDRLRKAGVVGGNCLRTFKARAFHQYLPPGTIDQSQYGDSLYRNMAGSRHW